MLANTFSFLSELKENNNKPWFDAHKTEFESAKAEFLVYVEEILKGIQAFDEKLDGLQAKDSIYRIYRDVRFSPDKTPYKTHFGAYFAEGGKKSKAPGYYLHIEPGGAFLGGGLYMPESDILQKVRQEIDYNGEKFLEIIQKPSFKMFYPTLWQEDKLSRPPKGYNADNPYLDFLKLKSIVCTYSMPKETLLAHDAAVLSVKVFKELHALQEFLREALV
jgi:uncharacterized protein (TIGR02453 family)